MSTILLTTWTIPDQVFQDMISAGHFLKAFALTVGEKSRWIFVFNLDVMKRRQRGLGIVKAVSVASVLELYYAEVDGCVRKGEWSHRKERAKWVFVPEMDNWYFTWPLSALAAFGVMDV
jgi:hypothetical protein